MPAPAKQKHVFTSVEQVSKYLTSRAATQGFAFSGNIAEANPLAIRQGPTNNLPDFGSIEEAFMWNIYYNANAFSLPLFRVLENIKNKRNLPIMDLSAIVFQNYACKLDADNSTGTLSNKLIEVCDLGLYEEICPELYEAQYTEDGPWTPGPGADNFEIPAIIMNEWMRLYTAQVGFQIDDLVFNGNPTPGSVVQAPWLDLCTGFLTRFEEDLGEGSDGVMGKIDGTTITSTNVLTELEKLFLSISNDLYKSTQLLRGLYIGVSLNVWRALQIYNATKVGVFASDIAATGNSGIGREGLMATGVGANTAFTFHDIPIYRVNALPDNTMYASFQDNLYLGTDRKGDMNSIRTLFKGQYSLNENFWQFAMRFRIGTQLGRPEFISYYRVAP